MKTTGYVIDSRYEAHAAPGNHPERPERITILRELMKRYKREGLVRIEPRPATTDELLTNHDPRHVEGVQATAGIDHFAFDMDTHTSAKTYETALLSAGGLLVLLDSVLEGRVDNGFAMVRPPGHHAESDRAMGFCFFNNVAIGARYLKNKYDIKRILIMDWDVHHGNGTQRSFFADPDVMYISTHEDGNYPGTGAVDEVGIADGIGRTINVPLPTGVGDAEYLQVFRRIVDPVARQFDPQFILISAGFDHHRLDPLGGMRVTREGMAAMTRSLLAVARDHAGGRCVAVLEGGYSLEALSESVACVVDEMGTEKIDDIADGGGGEAVIEAVQRILKRFWKF